jgi:hypothetical protein
MNAVAIPPNKTLASTARSPAKSPGSISPGDKAILTCGEGFVDPVRCREMVAEAAYFHAEHRGFEPGHELDDWLAAENQIDAALTLDETRRVYGDP